MPFLFSNLLTKSLWHGRKLLTIRTLSANGLYIDHSGAASQKDACEMKFGVVGHKAVAAQAMLNDSLNGHPGRIAGGVNLDSTNYGAVLTEGMGSGKKFFMLWDNIDHNSLPGPNNEPSFTQWWNITDQLDNRDWRVELSLANSTTATFTDLPLLADISGLRQTDPSPIDSAFGTINGVRSMSIETTYISDFFDMVLKGKKETLLGGPSKAYPEVAFVRLETL